MSPEKLAALAEEARAAYMADQLAEALAFDAERERAQTEAEAYHEQVMENPSQCKHGHMGCAAWSGGPCSDEVLSRAGM